LNHGVKWQLLANNPANAVEAPKPKKFRASFLDEKQVQNLLEVSSATQFEIPIILAALLGLRRGEVLGLKWQDINFKNGNITVCRELLKSKEDGVFFKDGTKNINEDQRVLNTSEIVLKRLKKHKNEQSKIKLSSGSDYQDNDLIVCRKNGAPIDPSSFSKRFAEFLDDNDMPAIRFHDLRHTNASLMLSLNIPAKVASERLGHSSIKITMDLYSHVMPTMQEEAARKLDSLFAVENKKGGR
jgi:integrase